MIFEEDHFKLLEQIRNCAKGDTVTSIIDTYFSPKNLSTEKTKRRLMLRKLLDSLSI